MNKRHLFGLIGEYITGIIYSLMFYRVIKRRFRTFVGEIDLICKRFNTIVFIEVKSRKTNYDDIIYTKRQQERLLKSAQIFLVSNPKYQFLDIRFDLVIIRPYTFPMIIKNFTQK